MVCTRAVQGTASGQSGRKNKVSVRLFSLVGFYPGLQVVGFADAGFLLPGYFHPVL